MSDERKKRRRIVMSTSTGGVNRRQMSEDQKKIEKRNKKLNRKIRRGKGLDTGGFRYGRKRVDYRGSVDSPKKSAQKSLDAGERSKTDAQVQAGIDKMKDTRRQATVTRTPATLGNPTTVALRRKNKKN